MVEYQSFIVKVPKSEQYIKIKLQATGQQAYMDYHYKNDHDFNEFSANKIVFIYQ